VALPKTPASADARVWFEQALDALEPLPESAATLEQGFEVRMDLAMVLNSLGKPLLARVREPRCSPKN
jgi:hypothetical protein